MSPCSRFTNVSNHDAVLFWTIMYLGFGDYWLKMYFLLQNNLKALGKAVAMADQLMWAIVTEMVEIFTSKGSQPYAILCCKSAGPIWSYPGKKRKKKWREALEARKEERKEKSLAKEGRKTVDQKTYYNAHTLRLLIKVR